MKTKLVLLLGLAVALTAGAQTNTPIPVLKGYFDAHEPSVSVAGTYNTANHGGGVELRGAYMINKYFGAEAGSSWTAGSGAFNNVAFGAIARYPLEKLKLPKLALYARVGGLYDWHTTSVTTTTPGRTYTVDAATELPCASGTPGSVTVTGPSTTVSQNLSGWGWYIGPGAEWRITPKLGLFGEAIREFRDGPDDWKFLCGLRYALGK